MTIFCSLLLACGPSGSRLGQTISFGKAVEINASQRADFISRINALRSKARRCGDQLMPAATPLALNDRLNRAAQLHSRDMHDEGFFEHEGSDGSSFSERIYRQDYNYAAAAENLGHNQRSAQALLDAWLDSPGHCRNLMSSKYSEVGIGYVNWLWTGVFASPNSTTR